MGLLYYFVISIKLQKYVNSLFGRGTEAVITVPTQNRSGALPPREFNKMTDCHFGRVQQRPKGESMYPR